jgi:IclR family transcriptional regulator, pca regulon regulatory protein
MEKDESADSEVITSVERALRVLQVFSSEHPSLSLTEMAQLIGLSRGTTRRILITFERLGFVRQDGRQFSLTPRVLRLGYGYVSSLPFWERAQPHLRELADSVRESSSIAVLDGSEIVYVARVPSERQFTLALTVGSRLPAHVTSMGHVLLAALPEAELEHYLASTTLEAHTPRSITDKDILRAELERVQKAGYSIANGERELGIQSVAAPIRDRTGAAIAAINVSTNSNRVSLSELKERILPQVLSTAVDISEELSFAWQPGT